MWCAEGMEPNFSKIMKHKFNNKYFIKKIKLKNPFPFNRPPDRSPDRPAIGITPMLIKQIEWLPYFIAKHIREIFRICIISECFKMDSRRTLCIVLVQATLFLASINAITCYKCRYNSNDPSNECINPTSATRTCNATQGCQKTYTKWERSGKQDHSL